jgi:hypothetical protein
LTTSLKLLRAGFSAFVDCHRAQRLHQPLLAPNNRAVTVAEVTVAVAVQSRVLLATFIIHVTFSPETCGINSTNCSTTCFSVNDKTALFIALEWPLLTAQTAARRMSELAHSSSNTAV